MSIPETFTLASDDAAARASAERLFAAVHGELAAILPPSADIRHIGATAVPGCLTKGDLDVAVRIEQQEFPAADEALERKFARNLGSVRTPTFAAFEDNGATPHLGIQLVVCGSEYDDFHRFTEALRADPQLVRDYNRLKLDWHGKPMDDYPRGQGRVHRAHPRRIASPGFAICTASARTGS